MRHRWIRIRRWAARALWVLLLLFIALFVIRTMVPALNPFMNPLIWTWLAILATWIVAIVGAWWTRGPLRWGVFTPERRRRHLLSLFDAGIHAAQEPGISLVRIRSRYQYARQGTKCVVEHVDGSFQDAWFWHTRPGSRAVLLVRGSGDRGPHSGRLNVLYVGSRTTGHGIVWSIPRSAWRAALRRARRAHRSAG